MKLIIDRFEGKFAVCETENKEMINISKNDLPNGVKEGDVLIETNGRYIIDVAETQKQKAEIEKLINDVFE